MGKHCPTLEVCPCCRRHTERGVRSPALEQEGSGEQFLRKGLWPCRAGMNSQMQEEQSVEKARRVGPMAPLACSGLWSCSQAQGHGCTFLIPKSCGSLSHHFALYPGTPGIQKSWHLPKLYSMFFRMFAHALASLELWSLSQPSAWQAILFVPTSRMVARDSLFWEAVWKWEKQ